MKSKGLVNAKVHAVGAVAPPAKICISPDAKHTIFVSPDAKHTIFVSPDAKPQYQPVEHRLHWVPGVGSLRWACTFHIFLLISFALGSRRKQSFQWDMGFRLTVQATALVVVGPQQPILGLNLYFEYYRF